ncbi:MAG: flagellar hook-basal body complex protein FliE [Candidatus Kapaibacterium sp.]
MVINEMDPGRRYLPLVQQRIDPAQAPGGDVSFVESMREFAGDVNSLQKDSTEQTERFIKGEPVDIHDVMITAQKAKTSFQLLMELRNKGLDLYREVMRMQV